MPEDDLDTFLIDNNPAALLPYSKRLIPEDPEVTELPPRILRDATPPELYDDAN